MINKNRDPNGVWFQREIQGLTMELYGVPQEPLDDRPGLTAEEDARNSLFDYATNGGRAFLGTLSNAALKDFIDTTPFDLRPVDKGRIVEIERSLVGAKDFSPVRMGVGDISERAFADFEERQTTDRLSWFDDALQDLS